MPTHGLQMTLRPRNRNTGKGWCLATTTQQELDQCLSIGDDDTSCSVAGDCCCADSTGCTHRDDMSCDGEGNHHDSSPPKASISERFSYLSPSFLAKIRKKSTKRASEANQESKERRTKQGRIQQLPYLVNLIRGIFVSERRNRIPCDDLIGIIMKRHRNAPRVIFVAQLFAIVDLTIPNLTIPNFLNDGDQSFRFNSFFEFNHL